MFSELIICELLWSVHLTIKYESTAVRQVMKGCFKEKCHGNEGRIGSSQKLWIYAKCFQIEPNHSGNFQAEVLYSAPVYIENAY